MAIETGNDSGAKTLFKEKVWVGAKVFIMQYSGQREKYTLLIRSERQIRKKRDSC
jgi:hypothetical protein